MQCYSQMQFKRLRQRTWILPITQRIGSVSQDTYIGTCVGVERENLLITAPRLYISDRGNVYLLILDFFVLVLGFFRLTRVIFLIWRRHHYR